MLRQILLHEIVVSADSSLRSIFFIFTDTFWFLEQMSVLGISAASFVWNCEETFLVALGNLLVKSDLVVIRQLLILQLVLWSHCCPSRTCLFRTGEQTAVRVFLARILIVLQVEIEVGRGWLLG